MDKIFAAIVPDVSGTQFFYIGEGTQEAAQAVLLHAHPYLEGRDVEFREMSGGIAQHIDLTPGGIVPYPEWTRIRVTGLTGKIMP